MFSELKSLIESLGYTVYDTDVPETPKYPYVVLWGDNSRPHVESPLANSILGVQDRLGVTCAAGTPAGVRIVQPKVRALLQPGGFPSAVGGFTLKLTDHQPPEVDRDEVITGTNRHPAYSVDIYTVTR